MNVPNHIAIILDGNGRWAKKRGMPRGYGHVKGCENLETICEVACRAQPATPPVRKISVPSPHTARKSD